MLFCNPDVSYLVELNYGDLDYKNLVNIVYMN